MSMHTAPHPVVDIAAPLAGFSRCHDGILSVMGPAAELPLLLAQAARARSLAGALVTLFHDTVMPHHAEEEKELFPSVQRSAQPGEEATRVHGMIDRLVHEHRRVESIWKKLEPALRAAAKGHESTPDPELLDELVQSYLAHARHEEEHFLPLAHEILGRNTNHMEALGVALQMRHSAPVIGYI